MSRRRVPQPSRLDAKQGQNLGWGREVEERATRARQVWKEGKLELACTELQTLTRRVESESADEVLLAVSNIALGSLLHENNEFNQSNGALLRALDICRRVGVRRPGIVEHATESLRLLSHNYRSQGMKLDAQHAAEEGVTLAEAGLSLCESESVFGKGAAVNSHLKAVMGGQLARCRNALAHAYLALSQPAKALELWEKVIVAETEEAEAQGALSEVTSPATTKETSTMAIANTMSWMVHAMTSLGMYPKAEETLTQIVQMRTRVRGATDPTTIEALLHLAWCASMQGRREAALQVYKAVHPSIIAPCYHIARHAETQSGNDSKELHNGLAMAQRALRIVAKTCPPGHRLITEILRLQATLYDKLGQGTEAARGWKRAMKNMVIGDPQSMEGSEAAAMMKEFQRRYTSSRNACNGTTSISADKVPDFENRSQSGDAIVSRLRQCAVSAGASGQALRDEEATFPAGACLAQWLSAVKKPSAEARSFPGSPE